ncbi:uncharacterized protein LOC106421438 [Brassica napus]|uniref:uncharacterized protein LOC106421438 n=1 Tax=Brassica napus TaxID=3708 RepID=UPI002079DBFC|nr:uncharacterized protein LOC106421438 [Brassica napus]
MSIWLINDSPRFSKTVRSMLELRQQLQLYLRCNVGDGRTALFWYDYWTDLGPLYTLFGNSGPTSLRIPLNANVSEAVCDGHWRLPAARSENAETLQVVLSTMSVPCDANGSDVYLSRINSGGFGASFSSNVTWERLRNPNPRVHWHPVVWFKEEIPRCSFITWTVFLNRLPTRDRLISWGLTLPPGCVLCSDADESHSHLFFECSFAAVVWNRYCGRFLASPPSYVAAVVDLSHQLQGPHGPRVVAVLKLLNQVIIYNLWRERNARIFRSVSLTQEAFFKVVDRCMRDRLLSLQSLTAVSPSLLELYFWFVSPYS